VLREEKQMAGLSSHERWARFRFSVVGPLFASPPAPGALQEELVRLSERTWQHPTTGEPVKFAVSTIERWYYAARGDNDPVVALKRKPRRDRGEQRSIGAELGNALRQQHREHPSWSYQLHFDNIQARIKEEPDLGPLPSYASVRRYMTAHGLKKRPRTKGRELREGELNARNYRESRETRSYEAEYVNGLWHLDFHHGSRKILTARGEWLRPVLLAILDDHSRLICHAQWYWQETAENLIHGLIQALCKRGLPRALMTDNGSAMLASETTQGLGRLSILHQTTLPYSPHQNAKQEVFWALVEGRLMAMLEGEPDLTLTLLNNATFAWDEMEYHRTVHSETNQPPLDRWLDHPSVGRECPGVDDLRLAFTVSKERTQRHSDGTISIAGTRFEVPARFSHLPKLWIRYASWDLSHVWLMDEQAGVALQRLYPLDKVRNADGHRRPVDPPPNADTPPHSGIAPLLRQLMSEYAATGLPPAYITKEDSP
jgi:transposase InsO family protein